MLLHLERLAKYQANERARRGRVTFTIYKSFYFIMQSFVNRYSTTSAVSQLRKAQRLAEEEEEYSDATWGSAAGFGNILKGSPAFTVPNVPDVSFVTIDLQWAAW